MKSPRVPQGNGVYLHYTLGDLEHDVAEAWIAQPPAWLEVCAPSLTPDLALLKADLDIGERDAILLARELESDELIIDDLRGRQEAQRSHKTFSTNSGHAVLHQSIDLPSRRRPQNCGFRGSRGAQAALEIK